MTRIVMLTVTALMLLLAAIFFPFLTIEVRGLSQQSSIVDAITVFASGVMVPLSLAVAALIVVLPMVRLVAILYTLAPMAIGWSPVRGAAFAFRLAERLKPWAMAEIFIVGVAVALVKIAGLAQLTIGPAFWSFAALVIISVFQDNLACNLTIWQTLDARRKRY